MKNLSIILFYLFAVHLSYSQNQISTIDQSALLKGDILGANQSLNDKSKINQDDLFHLKIYNKGNSFEIYGITKDNLEFHSDLYGQTNPNIVLKPGIYYILCREYGVAYWTYILAEPNYDGILEIKSRKGIKNENNYGFIFSPEIKSGRDVGLNNIFFLNSNLGWIVGNSGILLRTTDGGTTWELRHINMNNQFTFSTLVFNDVFFTDSISGWIVGDDGIILHTTDGGTNWKVTDYHPRSNFYYKVYFFNKQEGFIIDKNRNDSYVFSSIKYTNNSGNTWEIINKDRLVMISKDSYVDYYFFNKNIWKVTKKETLLSTDLCKTWKPFLNKLACSLIFIDSLNSWYITGADYLRWNLPHPDNLIHDNKEYIVNTKDGGKTWINQEINGRPYELFFVNEYFGWALCGGLYYDSNFEGSGFSNRGIYYTINGGKNWEEIIKPKGFKVPFSAKMFFLDKDKGFVLDKTYGIIYSTVDGGKNWSSINVLDLTYKLSYAQ